MTPIQTVKSAAEILDYRLTLTGDGFVGDTIQSATINSEGSVAASAVATNPAYYQYQISGGTVDTASLIRILITTAGGRVHEVEHSVQIVS